MNATVLGKLDTGTGPVELTAAGLEESFVEQEAAFSAALAAALPSVLLGQRFDGSSSTAMRVIDTPLAGLDPVIDFTSAAGLEISAIVVPGQYGVQVFVAADLQAGRRWVDIAQMRAFNALPQSARSTQRNAWISRLAALPKSKWPTGLDLSGANLKTLATPVLRLLVALLGERTVPVTGVDQPADGWRGGQTRGVTLPLFNYPLEEPGCYIPVIAGREGVLESINAYDQGAGISLGPIQYNAQRGAILKFLRRLDEVDQALFAATFGVEGWRTAIQNGVAEITVTTAGGEAVTLVGDGSTKQVARSFAFFQSKDPAQGKFAQIDANWRKRLANRLRDAAVWPHVQVIIDEIAADWLGDGLTIVDASIPAIDKRRPARDTFVLRALLHSAYVRYSGSLTPLLRALEPFASPGAKLGGILSVLRDPNTNWDGLTKSQRKKLADRLEAQKEEAVAVWETVIKLADGGSSVTSLTPTAMALMAKPIVIVDEDLELHDGLLAAEGAADDHNAEITLDPSVAIPPFSEPKKSTISQPLLGAMASATAIAWNQARHPQISGVPARQIADAVRSYVDLGAVEAALGSEWGGGIDAVFVEVVHQFQCKVFADPSDHDGRAGEASLDALGLFFGRPALNGVDIANAKAQAYLNRPEISGALSGASDNPAGLLAITASNWFHHMMQASFLGQKFSNGIHAALVRRLRTAERHLLLQPQYSGMTPVELGAALGIRESHKGSRPNADTGSMHTMGLATDINYVGNPWLKGTQFTDVLRRAAVLIDGVTVGPGKAAALFFSLTELPTAEIYDTLAGWNAAFKSYLALAQDSGPITALLEGHKVAHTPGVFESAAESVPHASERWRVQISEDLHALGAASGFGGRDPKHGFLDLNRDLVVALRDRGCLAWGATDFGPGDDGSGDVMHFDCRNTGIGRIVNRGFAPAERHCA